MARALRNIYNRQVDVSTEVEPELFNETLQIFNRAAAMGVTDAVMAGCKMPSNRFLQNLKDGNAVFSAFRVHRMQNDIAAMMTDDRGQLKPFARFARDVTPYTSHQNSQWLSRLSTEYNTAVIRAHQAADWQQFEFEKDVLPNLEWMPSTSPSPGADHRVFWGTILPVDDPFWDQHRPGDRWNCKCSLRSTDRGATPRPGGVSRDDMPHRGLENNPGKDGHLVSDRHTYFPSSCASCPFAGSKLTALYYALSGKKKDCYGCGKVEKKVEKAAVKVVDKRITEKAKQEYDTLNPNKYEKTFFDKKTGGYVATEKQRLAAAKANKQEAAKYAKEKAMCLAFAKGGNKIVHLGEVARISSADVTCNGMKADLKRTGSENNMIDYAKHARKSQGAKLVLFQFDKWNAKMASALKEITKLKIHGKYFITGRDNEIIDF